MGEIAIGHSEDTDPHPVPRRRGNGQTQRCGGAHRRNGAGVEASGEARQATLFPTVAGCYHSDHAPKPLLIVEEPSEPLEDRDEENGHHLEPQRERQAELPESGEGVPTAPLRTRRKAWAEVPCSAVATMLDTAEDKRKSETDQRRQHGRFGVCACGNAASALGIIRACPAHESGGSCHGNGGASDQTERA
jgi:hypothetical protein